LPDITDDIGDASTVTIDVVFDEDTTDTFMTYDETDKTLSIDEGDYTLLDGLTSKTFTIEIILTDNLSYTNTYYLVIITGDVP